MINHWWSNYQSCLQRCLLMCKVLSSPWWIAEKGYCESCLIRINSSLNEIIALWDAYYYNVSNRCVLCIVWCIYISNVMQIAKCSWSSISMININCLHRKMLLYWKYNRMSDVGWAQQNIISSFICTNDKYILGVGHC